MILDNASGAAFRADANAALAALASTMKGPNAPPAPIAGMMWLDDDTPSASVWTLKIYDGADWLAVGFFDISANTFAPAIARLILDNGFSTVPTFSFSSDSDTGIYLKSDGVLAISCAGVERMTISAAALLAASADARFEKSNVRLRLVSSVGTPSTLIGGSDSAASFMGTETNTRFYMMTNGVERMGVAASGGVDVAGNLSFNSGYGSAALAFGCRAWVNFNGTGAVAIRGSGGVTSITDNGLGDYTVNFNFTMPGTNYAAAVSGGSAGTLASANAATAWPAIYSTTSLRIGVSDNSTDTNVDVENVNVIVVR
jgi:hypothetical protein